MISRLVAASLAAPLFAVICTPVRGQAIALTVGSPITASATSAGLTGNASLGVGPWSQPTVPSVTALAPGALPPSAFVTLAVLRQPSPTGMRAWVQFGGSVQGSAAGSVAVQANDVMLSFSLPQPTAVRLALTRSLNASAGVPVPTMRIDVGNNGSFELTEVSPSPFVTNAFVVGPTPTIVRLQLAASFAVHGSMNGTLEVEMLPGPLTVVTDVGAGCGALYGVSPRFDGGVDLVFDMNGLLPEIGVVGFGVQPAVLAPGPAPCLLLPSADVLLTSQSLTLALPPAVRPVTLWTQNVELTLTPLSLRSSNAFRIDAP